MSQRDCLTKNNEKGKEAALGGRKEIKKERFENELEIIDTTKPSDKKRNDNEIKLTPPNELDELTKFFLYIINSN